MNFVDEFNKRVQKIDANLTPKRKIEKKQQVFGELYSIYKRQLVRDQDPRHQLNQCILWNLPIDEIQWWMKKLKTKLIDEENGIVEYYEKVKQSGKYADVLNNECTGRNLIKECGDYDREIAKPDWKG